MVIRDLLTRLTLSAYRRFVLSRDTGLNMPPMSLAPLTDHTIPDNAESSILSSHLCEYGSDDQNP